jgi:type III restriction enzyme
MSNLSKTFDTLDETGFLDEKVSEIPNYIINNLNPKFKLRYYQKKAIKRFIFYLEHYNKRKKPTHLLYHMATGSGKTLIMATNILYLYGKGYNKFIFFVNSTDTIEKTKDNFLNKGASKYLFNENISFSEKNIRIRSVDNFEGVNEEDINILFSTIQGLYSDLNSPKENSITYEDFEDEEIVLISDEAHHINALTKSNSQMTISDQQNINTWEGTVNSIFNKNRENMLLEFTATVELDDEDVKEKYDDKIIYKYPLKQFRIDKFSKEVKVLEGDFNKKTRALQAIILSQYRRKVAEKNNIVLKPVVMMKSKNISMSEDFEEKFLNMVNNLQPGDLLEVKNNSNSSIKEAFTFFKQNNITLDNLVKELKEDFSKEKCVSVNSKNESEEKQILVNTLEDKDNQIRVVFAVSKLNEGWDVLNLFDIVRIYETRGSRHGKPGKTTISEAQLIGRGARYYPFKVNEEQNMYKRKYDDDTENELKILEDLYYHCYNEPRYISELKIALEDEGIIPSQKKEAKLKVKKEFKNSQFWRTGLIFKNKREEKDRTKVTSLDDLNVDNTFKYRLRTGRSAEITIFEEKENFDYETDSNLYNLSGFRNNILRKALDQLEFYKFNNLKEYFPNLSSIKEFINDKKYLASRKVEVNGSKYQVKNLSSKEKLEVTRGVCEKIAEQIKSNFTKYEGTEIFIGEPVKEIVQDKTRIFALDDNKGQGEGIGMSETNNTELQLDLSKKKWYVYNENYGTDQEKYFIKFLNNMIEDLSKNYNKVYLIRNERLFQIYDFDQGRPFEPDFVLYLKKKESGKILHYQLFVEPKGDYLIEHEEWKENFLEEIKEKYKIEIFAENNKFKIIGLPFYNKELKESEFEKSLLAEIEIKE